MKWPPPITLEVCNIVNERIHDLDCAYRRARKRTEQAIQSGRVNTLHQRGLLSPAGTQEFLRDQQKTAGDRRAPAAAARRCPGQTRPSSASA